MDEQKKRIEHFETLWELPREYKKMLSDTADEVDQQLENLAVKLGVSRAIHIGWDAVHGGVYRYMKSNSPWESACVNGMAHAMALDIFKLVVDQIKEKVSA